MPKSTEQLRAESNARHQQLNAENLAKGHLGIQYNLNRETPTGSESYRDPAFSMDNPAYASAFLSKQAKPTEAGATMWSGNEPGSAFYSPTGSDWQLINEGMLSDPTVAQAVMKGAAGPLTLASRPFSALKAKIPTETMQGIEGSSFSLAPDVLNKMWR